MLVIIRVHACVCETDLDRSIQTTASEPAETVADWDAVGRAAEGTGGARWHVAPIEGHDRSRMSDGQMIELASLGYFEILS